MSSKEDNVMDLLDSLDAKPSQKSKPKKSSSKRKDAPKKGASDDILGFLNELDLKKEGFDSKGSSETTTKATQTETSDGAECKQEESAEKAAAPDSSAPKEALSTDATQQDINSASSQVIDPMSTISSWWTRNKGGLWSTAQNAVQDAMNHARQAEALVREEQQNFSLNSLQTRLTSVLNTIVPPIGRHEQLKIHIFHDMVGYPNVDKLLYEVFDYVMDQVEGGGELNLVVQKGQERHKAASDHDVHRSLNYAMCELNDGVKLAKANVDAVRDSALKAREAEEAAGGDTNIRISEVYVSIQPVITPGETSTTIATSTESLYFVVYLADFEHNIELSTASQAFPAEWAQWLDSDGSGFREAAIDPREWVTGWVEDGLNLAFGVVAQKYVTTRMGLTRISPNASATSD